MQQQESANHPDLSKTGSQPRNRLSSTKTTQTVEHSKSCREKIASGFDQAKAFIHTREAQSNFHPTEECIYHTRAYIYSQ